MSILTEPPKVFGDDCDHGLNQNSLALFDQAPDLNNL